MERANYETEGKASLACGRLFFILQAVSFCVVLGHVREPV
jgi:hypothetical protein